MRNPFGKHRDYTLEYTHLSGHDLFKFIVKSDHPEDLFHSHFSLVDKFLKEQEERKKEFSTKQKEALK
jgi:hypothetical protein